MRRNGTGNKIARAIHGGKIVSDTKFQLIGEQDKPMIEVISPNPDFPPVITVEDIPRLLELLEELKKK